MKKLYHGTKTLIKDGVLKPNICFELESFVYATDNYEYALIRSGNFDITKFRVREEHEKDYHELCEIYEGAFEELFDRPGYIYLVDRNDFKPLRESEFVSEHEVRIIDTIYIENILDEINKSDKIKLIRTNDLEYEEYWSKIRGGKQGYLHRKQESVNEVLSKRES